MSSNSNIHLVFSSFFTLAAFQLYAASQTDWAGRIVDSSHQPIAGARIEAHAEDSGQLLSYSVSDHYGEFSLSLPETGCTLQVTRRGFATLHLSYAGLGAAPPLSDIELQIEHVSDTITVSDSAYRIDSLSAATKTPTVILDVPQSITVVSREQMRDQLMASMADVVQYVPGITTHQGENNRDQVIIRGNSSSADFYVNGVRDDVQYYRDLYNLERVEALKGPNAMIFGRGGGGGVINRVTKEAAFLPFREISLQGGSFGNKRAAADVNQPFGSKAALRMNLMYEDTNSFRNNVGMDRYGLSPTLLLSPGQSTKVSLSYERFHDARVGDRGISSFGLRPLDIPIRTYFGDPTNSPVLADVNLGSALVEHQAGFLNIRNRTQFAGYDRRYQNYVPGAVTSDGLRVVLSSYNNATSRLNVFNQTDLTYTRPSGRIRHTLLGGMEWGRQGTDNLRKTGYFNNAQTAIDVPVASPAVNVPVTFRQSATDADNHVRTLVGAAYVQDQLEITRYLRVVAGLRFDHFNLNYRNNRTSETLERLDRLWSPRVGLLFKPRGNVSAYGNYSVSYLPSAGDQFSSLTTVTQQVKPEKFTNYEVGLKWDLRPAFSVTSALYRLDRTNTRSTDPNDATRIVQTGSARTNGFELGLNGNVMRKWRIAGGYAHQNAFISSATTAAAAGALVAQVPHHTFSLWNHYQFAPRFGAGLGVVNRAEMFAAISNTVKLPGYTRLDVAAFYSINERIRLQANVENLADIRYYANADNNTNISPGSPRAVKLALTARF